MAELAQIESDLLEWLRSIFGELRFDTIGLLRQAASDNPDRPAILAPERTSLTYRGLLALAEKTVGTLNALGFSRASRIALALPATSEAVAAYLSVMAGMTILPTGPGLPADEYTRYLRHARADAVMVQAGATGGAVEAAKRLGIAALELAYKDDGPVGLFEIVGAPAPLVEPQYARPEDTAVVLPTSGTTNLPKLVPWEQGRLATATYYGLRIFPVLDVPRYVMVGFMPLQLASGFGPMVRALAWQSGFASTPASSIDQIYHYLAYYRPASVLLVPTLLQSMVDEAPFHAEETGRWQLKRITAVSAALPEQLLRDVQRVFGVSVQILYGMTEMLAISGQTFGPEDSSYKLGCVGPPHRYGEVQVVDEDGVPLPAGQIGAIQVLSPRSFGGYENDAEANGEAFRDGWFRTGDNGYYDENGALWLAGRAKELINRAGSKVIPLDVDAVLLQHPAVADAATFAFPHSVLGEDVAAAIVLRDQEISERELRSFAARHLASYKVPSRFVFVSSIPRTTLGKIKRLALAEQFKAELKR
jgi:acyl-CoA synthetase (AMP-forming)/AMP-acid ligase II